jgi:hypothetical protein
MAVAANALTNLQSVKDYLQITGAKEEDEKLLENLINRVSTFFETFVGYTFASGSHTEYHSTNGGDSIFPKYLPIISVTSIYDDTNRDFDSSTLIASSDYVIMHNRYIQLINTSFSVLGVYNIKLVYSAGYATIPGDIAQACIEEVSRRYWNHSKNKQLGVSSRTLPDGSMTLFDGGLLPQVKEVLNYYRKYKV